MCFPIRDTRGKDRTDQRIGLYGFIEAPHQAFDHGLVDAGLRPQGIDDCRTPVRCRTMRQYPQLICRRFFRCRLLIQ